MNDTNNLGQRVSEADPARLNAYIDLFDKFLLYNMAANMLPPEAIEDILEKWEESVKMTINSESGMRTHFLESTIEGRMAKKHNQPDGEQLRLSSLDTLDIARMILIRNLKQEKDEFGYDDPEFS